MSIQWFPGHMTRAKREMEEKMKQVDMIIELRDARVVDSSRNPMIDTMSKEKPRVIVLTKIDKANPIITEQWIKLLQEEGNVVIAFDLLKDKIKNPVIQASKLAMQEKLERMKRRGIRPRAIRAMVVGIPNVGKSTFINQLLGKKVVETANRPGVTRSLKTIKIDKELELLDTPGILWPKFENSVTGIHLALTGAINDQILPFDEIIQYAIKHLLELDPNVFKNSYGSDAVETNALLEELGRKRGFLLSGNQVDIEKTQLSFLKDLRDDKLIRVSWDVPDESI